MSLATGWNGSVSFDGRFVTIRRNTIVGRLTMGRSDKRIPVGQLTAVQLKAANVVSNGFVQFSFSGAEERNDTRLHRVANAANDENSVVFLPWHNAAFNALRDEIEQAMARGASPDDHPEPTAHTPADPRAVLEQLAGMFDAGLLSAEEYATKKAEVLRRL